MGTTTTIDAPPVPVPPALAPVLVLVRAPDRCPVRAPAHARIHVHSIGCAPAHVRGKGEKGTMNTMAIVRRVARRPTDAATGIQHVLVLLSAPSALSVLVVITPSTLAAVPVMEGDSDVVVLRLSDMPLVSLILRGKGQDENVNIMFIASGSPLLVVLSVAALAVAAVGLCLDGFISQWACCVF